MVTQSRRRSEEAGDVALGIRIDEERILALPPLPLEAPGDEGAVIGEG